MTAQAAMPSPKSSRAIGIRSTIGAMVVLLLAACASVPNPTAEMATARAAVESAQRADANTAAPTEMSRAQQLLTEAEKAQSAEEYARARRAAEAAKSNAELAEAKTQLEKARQAKAEIDQTLNAMRTDAARTPR